MIRPLRLTKFAVLAFILLPLSISKAVNLEISPIKFENDAVTAEISINDSLPSNLTAYMKKGVPISFDYKLELWRSRAGWLDKLVDNVGTVYRLRYDTWDKEYTIISEQSRLTVEYILEEVREASDLVKSSGRLRMSIDDESGDYYIVGKLAIKTMSLSNLKEVESWLKGEISGAKKPKIRDTPDKFSEFLFNTALKVSGLKNISEEARSPFFKIKNGAVEFQDE
jgi:hypothetical protein